MNTQIKEKNCRNCGKLIKKAAYKSYSDFKRVFSCSNKCRMEWAKKNGGYGHGSLLEA